MSSTIALPQDHEAIPSMDTPSEVIKVIDLVPGTVRELPAMAVQRLDADSFWRDYVSRHRPLVIKGGAGHWPAVGKWSQPGYLESIPSKAVAWLGRTFNPAQIAVLKKIVEIKSIAECVKEMRAADPGLTYSIPALPLPAEWEADLGDYPFLPAKLARKPRIYPQRRVFVYRNASTEWHYHPTDETLTTQLSGSKRISLFRLTSENWEDCRAILEANLHHLSCGRRFFPRDLRLVKYEAVLEPGDVAYLPPYWWHGIDPADSGLGATLAHCFRTPLHRFGAWGDPITQSMLPKRPKEWLRAPLLLGMIALSALTRRIKGVPWLQEV